MSVIFWSLNMMYLGLIFWSHFLLGVLWVSCIVVWCVTLIWGKSIISISNIFLLFFSFWYSHYACVIICLCDPQLMDVLLCLFQSFYFYFSVWGFLLSYPQAERLFTQPCPIYYWDQQRHSSFLLQCFWSEALLFDSCLEFTSSLYIIHLFSHVLSVEVFSILIIVF